MKLNKCLGVYLSDRAFSVSHVSSKGEKYEVDLIHWEKVNLNIDEPEDVKFAFFAKRIKEILRQKKIRTRNAIFCISGMNVFNRKRQLPNVIDRKLKGIVRYEAFQVIPFPYEQIYLQYYPYRNSERATIDVWMMAVKRELVQNFTRRIKKIGLKVNRLEVSSLSLFNLVLSDNAPMIGENTFGAIYFGLSSVDISIGNKDQLGFTRTSPFAGSELAKSLAKKEQVSFLNAEEIRDSKVVALLDGMEEKDLPEGYDYKLSLHIKPVMERMAADVRRSIDFYISQPDGVAVENLFISGPLCSIPFFKDFVEEHLGIPAQTKEALNPDLFESADISPEDLAAGYSSLSLAFDGVSEPHTLIDFLPPEVKDLRNLREKKIKVAVCGALVAINVAIAGTLGTAETSRIQSTIMTMQRSIQQGQDVAQQYDNAVNSLRSMNRILKYLASFKKGDDVLKHTDLPLLILLEVNENIPLDSVWLESFRFTEEKKSFMVVKTVDSTRFWSVIDELNKHPMLSIRVLSRREEQDDTLGRRVERFSLEMSLITGEEEAAPPPDPRRTTTPRRR